MKFALESLKSPKALKDSGTIFSCTPGAGRFALSQTDLSSKKRIVELGCGTGPFTKEILKQKEKNAAFIGLEINKELASATKKKYPHEKILAESAEDLKEILDKEGLKNADCIISTLPWIFFSEKKQKKLLNEIKDSLDKDGEFITIGTMFSDKTKGGKRFKKLLFKTFKDAKKTKLYFKNIPPVFFYHVKK